MYVLYKQGIYNQEGVFIKTGQVLDQKRWLLVRPHLQQNCIPMVSLRLLPIMGQMLWIMMVLGDESKCNGVLSDQSKKRRTFDVTGCAKKKHGSSWLLPRFCCNFIHCCVQPRKRNLTRETKPHQREHRRLLRFLLKLQSRLHPSIVWWSQRCLVIRSHIG